MRGGSVKVERPAFVVLPACERLWSAREVGDFLGVPVATLHQ